jgi:stage IV sporulation protein FB
VPVVKIADINFKLNLLFLLVLFIFAICGLFFKAAVSFLVVILHELAHSLMAYREGIEIKEIELLPFGGVARFRDLIKLSPETEIKVSLAGPLFNFLAVGFTAVLMRYDIIQTGGIFFIHLNASIGAFNLIPVLPLDGGRVWRAYLAQKHGFKEATYKVTRYSKVFAVLLALFIIISIYLGYVNITLVVLCFFVYFAALKEGRYTPYVLMQYIAKKKGQVRKKEVLQVQELVAFTSTPVKQVIDKLVPSKFHIVVVVDDEFNMLGSVTEDQLINSLIEEQLDVSVGELL